MVEYEGGRSGRERKEDGVDDDERKDEEDGEEER